jgi:hypothetical protein
LQQHQLELAERQAQVDALAGQLAATHTSQEVLQQVCSVTRLCVVWPDCVCVRVYALAGQSLLVHPPRQHVCVCLFMFVSSHSAAASIHAHFLCLSTMHTHTQELDSARLAAQEARLAAQQAESRAAVATASATAQADDVLQVRVHAFAL